MLVPTFPQSPRTRRAMPLAFILSLALAWATLPTFAGAPPRATPPLTIVERTLEQEQGGWLISYKLRYHGPNALVIAPADVLTKVAGWVSNSRVCGHAVPRLSSVVVSGTDGSLLGSGDVITSADDAKRCRERVVVRIWTDGAKSQAPAMPPPYSTATSALSFAGRELSADERPGVVNVAPEGIVRVRIRLEHMHVIFGDYDPLLGARDLELHLGPAVFRDALPLEREQYLAQAKAAWTAPPEERRDTRMFISAPDSLHLEAHIPGNQYYRFPERPVRYGTKMRLRFWYYVAQGTEGACQARVAQYKETPTAWKQLADGVQEECLTTVGRWVKVERVFQTEREATTISLDFKISGATEVGEMWIDDVSLEPVQPAPAPRP
jgi:hypothetical protein